MTEPPKTEFELIGERCAQVVNDWAPRKPDGNHYGLSLIAEFCWALGVTPHFSLERRASTPPPADKSGERPRDHQRISCWCLHSLHCSAIRRHGVGALQNMVALMTDPTADEKRLADLTSEIWGEAIRLRGVNNGPNDVFDKARHMLWEQWRALGAAEERASALAVALTALQDGVLALGLHQPVRSASDPIDYALWLAREALNATPQ